MTELEKAARQALEALEGNCTNPAADPEQAANEDAAITALHRALEQPAQHIEHCIWARSGNTPCPHVQLPKPLTDAQIGAVAADIWGSVLIAPQSYQAFARAIEAAHGITGEKK